MAIADKLQSILDSKAAIKAAIEEKGVTDVGDVLADYPSKIASIQSGGGFTSGWTGHADAEGLKAIGWTDDDIAYYQQHGVDWNEEDDEYHKVPQDNIELYGVINTTNIQDYKDILVYMPKIDTSGMTSMVGMFSGCNSLIAVPKLNTEKVTSMERMFSGCLSFVCSPEIKLNGIVYTGRMFESCYSLRKAPLIDTSRCTNIGFMYSGCYALNSIPILDTSNCTYIVNLFFRCCALETIPLINAEHITYISSAFDVCYSLQHIKISNLKVSVNLSATSVLSKESVLYIIDNAAPTKPITITLSAYCYNKYNADEDVVAALTKQPNISLASA